MIKAKLLILLVILALTGCVVQDKTAPPMEQGDFAHTVYFWLNNPENQNDIKAFEKSLIRFISNSKYIKTMHVGIPAATNRDVIDTTYTYSLLLTFSNKADHDKYQEEDIHKRFIQESAHLWKKVLVYDSENILNR